MSLKTGLNRTQSVGPKLPQWLFYERTAAWGLNKPLLESLPVVTSYRYNYKQTSVHSVSKELHLISEKNAS